MDAFRGGKYSKDYFKAINSFNIHKNKHVTINQLIFNPNKSQGMPKKKLNTGRMYRGANNRNVQWTSLLSIFISILKGVPKMKRKTF